MDTKAVVIKKKDVFCNNDLVGNIKKEINFLEVTNKRHLQDQEVKLVVLVKLLEYMTDGESLDSKHNEKIKELISNKKLLSSVKKDRSDKIMSKNITIDNKITLKVKQGTSYMITITNDDYQNALRLAPNNKAYLRLNNTTNHFVYQDELLYLDGLKELTQAQVKDLKGLDLNFLSNIFTLVVRAFINVTQKGESFNNMQFEIKAADLYYLLHGKRNLNKANKQQLFRKMNSYNIVMGIIEGVGEFNIFSAVEYIYNTDCITFISKYFEYLVKSLYKDSLKEDKKDSYNKQKLDLSDYDYLYTNKIKSTVGSIQDKSAYVTADIIVKTITKRGKGKESHLSILKILSKNVQLANNLMNSKDPGRILKRHFNNVYKILENYTDLGEYCILPTKNKNGSYDPNWIPTKANYKNFNLIFKPIKK